MKELCHVERHRRSNTAWIPDKAKQKADWTQIKLKGYRISFWRFWNYIFVMVVHTVEVIIAAAFVWFKL